MNTFIVTFDYTGHAPAKSTLEGWIRDIYSNVKAVSDIKFKITTPDSEENFTLNMKGILKKKYTNGKLTSVTVEEN